MAVGRPGWMVMEEAGEVREDMAVGTGVMGVVVMVGELEVEDGEGREALGEDLMVREEER